MIVAPLHLGPLRLADLLLLHIGGPFFDDGPQRKEFPAIVVGLAGADLRLPAPAFGHIVEQHAVVEGALRIDAEPTTSGKIDGHGDALPDQPVSRQRSGRRIAGSNLRRIARARRSIRQHVIDIRHRGKRNGDQSRRERMKEETHRQMSSHPKSGRNHVSRAWLMHVMMQIKLFRFQCPHARPPGTRIAAPARRLQHGRQRQG